MAYRGYVYGVAKQFVNHCKVHQNIRSPTNTILLYLKLCTVETQLSDEFFMHKMHKLV